MLIPLLGGAHPLVALYTKVDETMAALIGARQRRGRTGARVSYPRYIATRIVVCYEGGERHVKRSLMLPAPPFIAGHDGFGSPPGSGSQTHYLHHAYIDCNYGESYVPIDWMMGTFVANEEEYTARKAAAEAKRGKKAA